MKLFRFGEAGKEKPGVCINDKYLDLSTWVEDYNEHFFQDNGIEKLRQVLIDNKNSLPAIPKGSRLGSPTARPSKIVCIGLNYVNHAKETGSAIPVEPIIFLKSTTALTGINDTIILPKDSTKTDWEVELAVVISKKASYVEEAFEMDYVAGYSLMNDVSERAFQYERGGTWDKGKGCDTFAPMGPFLVTADEIKDPHNLRLWLKLNDFIMQDGNTADLIFNIPVLISYVSRFMTLLPGDIISTGTPPGVGYGMKPQVFLKDGDIIQLGIDGVGSGMQQVKNHRNNL